MARPFRPARLTANHLITGRSIWRAADGRWVSRPDAAELIADEALAKARLAEAEAEGGAVVDPYLAPAEPGVPGALREAFRASGPSAAAQVSWGAGHA